MKTFAQLIDNQNTPFTKLIIKTEQNKNYDRVLKSLLDPNLAQHCNFAKMQKEILVVTVDNASWATRFRYAIPDILKILPTQPIFKDIKKIRYLIATPLESTPPKKPKATLSPQNEKLWHELLQEIK